VGSERILRRHGSDGVPRRHPRCSFAGGLARHAVPSSRIHGTGPAGYPGANWPGKCKRCLPGSRCECRSERGGALFGLVSARMALVICCCSVIRRCRMPRGLMVLIVAMSLVCGATGARAQQWVTNIACDSVLVGGILRPRVSFEVRNWDPRWGVAQVVARQLGSAGTEDTCGVVSAAGPEKWDALPATMGTGEVFVMWARAADDAPYPAPGGSLGGFQLVLTPGHSCCFEFQFIGWYPEPLAYETVCFECGRVVPIIGRTWGAVKALYR
jgi:hypothetical protein